MSDTTEKIIGRASATEKAPNQSNEFSFWLAPDVLVNPFDIVEAESYQGSKTFGLVLNLEHATDASTHLSNYISNNFGEADEAVLLVSVPDDSIAADGGIVRESSFARNLIFDDREWRSCSANAPERGEQADYFASPAVKHSILQQQVPNLCTWRTNSASMPPRLSGTVF